jgi:hypothetical protein
LRVITAAEKEDAGTIAPAKAGAKPLNEAVINGLKATAENSHQETGVIFGNCLR